MSLDMNLVMLIGRLTQDPELRYTPNGHAVCSFSLAVNRKSFGENAREEVFFFNITTWNKIAETCSKYLNKGKQVAVQGYLQQRRWEDQNGQKRSIVDVVADRVQFLGAPSGGGGQSSYNQSAGAPPQPAQPSSGGYDAPPFPEEDDIPF